MKTKLFTLVLLLMGMSVGAQSVSVSVSEDCSQNGKHRDYKNGHGCVDLGLSVKWATMNVGATTPEDNGYYFAWGEVSTKSEYTWATYKFCNGIDNTMTKYCIDSTYGTVDGKAVLDLEDDAACANWGGNWRMPTNAEWSELRVNCTWTDTTQNEVSGYKVTGSNGNSIFLPRAGMRYKSRLTDVGSFGHYWSSSLCDFLGNRAYVLFINAYYSSYYDERYNGFSVRPVCKEAPVATYYTLTLYANGCDSANTFTCNEGLQLSVSAIPMEGRSFVRWNDGNTDNPRLITLNQDMTLTATFENASPVTDIDEMAAPQHVVKFIRDGQLYIVRDGKLYTPQGALVE